MLGFGFFLGGKGGILFGFLFLLGLKPNGFTEPTHIKDYPIRNRKVLLHVRRRRYLDADNRNVILNQYPLTADGTKVSVEFGLFFKDSDGQASIDSSVISKILSY